ncbi:plasmid replication protein RepC [Falsirhodobacter sp. 20TX0035]|uniref:plasmid replication protein RepC n=1 Tax=Falsirhodobacter sp. 20TX0035 TaxID=3022019 RepID=UPI00232C773D|nr:plasmid replication protein RepC [Falsirhodobacter sp. 20TX0035]MDB6454266.1 plasmid replication protein RepC [Falsirhodobacter sp. 20TX0035]
MAFRHATAPGLAPATDGALSASRPLDLKTVYRSLASIAPTFGLTASVLATLRAMISCVRPEKGMVCFASTATLLRLRSGGSERTVRRHVEQLQDAGILCRNDSPNGKRYAMRDAVTGETVAYGFDLSPMFERATDWSDLAEKQAAEENRRKYLRTVILGRLHRLDKLESGVDTAEFRKILRRRNLPLLALEDHLSTVVDLLAALEPSCHAPPERAWQDETVPEDGACHSHEPQAPSPTVTGGQNVRHQSRSETEHPDSDCARPVDEPQADAAKLLRMTSACCTEAMSFAQEPPASWTEMERLAMMLGPMIGIGTDVIREAAERNGRIAAALTVLLVLQMGCRITNYGAYYRSVTLGSRRADFDPARILMKLSRART